METINKYRIDKSEKLIISSGAAFYLNRDHGCDKTYYHVCDNIRVECMPEIFRHDIHNTLYLDDKYIRINYCPLCGKKL